MPQCRLGVERDGSFVALSWVAVRDLVGCLWVLRVV